ncbi:MAG: AAA family ATPase [Candidatus Dormibacteraeota bacterium]|nr:AAA family ATPase [Candidatus Dormibacteraeota bacterium]
MISPHVTAGTPAATASAVRVHLLGGFRIEDAGTVISEEAWRRRHAASLVKLLALAPGRHLHREQVTDLLWPDLPPADALPRLRKAVYYARRTLKDPTALLLRNEEVALWPAREVTTDVDRFESLASNALAGLDIAACAVAAAAYHAELLPGDRYEPWFEERRELLSKTCQELLRRAGLWERLLELEPTDEEAHLALMQVKAAVGNHQAVVRQFERLKVVLHRELGVEPGAAAVRVHRAAVAALDRALVASELIGREAEVATAAAVLEDAAGGRTRLLLVQGETGVGKSRLCAALVELADRSGWITLQARARRDTGRLPYVPLFDALEDLRFRRPELFERLPEPMTLELQRMHAAAQSGQPPAAGPSGHERLFFTVSRLLRGPADARGVLLFIDDVDAADDATLAFLSYLAGSGPGERLLVLAAGRPQEPGGALARFAAGLLAQPSVRELSLGPLNDVAAAAIVQRRAVRRLDSATVGRIVELAGGNPFALEELAAGISPSGELRIPARLSAVLSSRIDSLEPELRSVLPRIAIAGTVLTADQFVVLSGLGEERAFELLDEALAAGVLVPDPRGYRFRHGLVRERLIAILPPHRQEQAHRLAAARLADRGAGPAIVGHHLLAAGRGAEAVPWLKGAAEAAGALGAYRDALVHVEAALPHASQDQRPQLLELRAGLLAALGDPSAVSAYRDAISAAGLRRDVVRTRLARFHVAAGDMAGAAEAMSGVDVEQHEASDRARMLLVQGMVAWSAGDADAAAEKLDAARPLALAEGLQPEMFDSIALRGLVAHHRGEWSEQARAELLGARASPELASVIFDAHLCWAEYLLYGQESYERVIEFALALRQTATDSGVARAVSFATALLGEAELLTGRLEEAEEHLQEAVRLHRDLGAAAGEAHSLTRLAEASVGLGKRAEARGMLEQALRLARWSPLSKHLMLRVYGTLINAAGGPQEARALVHEAEAMMGPGDQCNFCQIMFQVPAAIACALAGDVGTARSYLALAERSLPFWSGEAWRAAVDEVRGHLSNADGDHEAAARFWSRAAEAFARAGQPLDAMRCATAAGRA